MKTLAVEWNYASSAPFSPATAVPSKDVGGVDHFQADRF